ncbi:MAG: glycosyltransferase family 4 protein [Candidatus Fermentibacteraceae bacterium]|nr:glycosyltransferase family 4 protein [Candidatus Fermentibacteraceae bacterium]MBN2607969.1 glycosyltransferase family 4 protein [Candidatus Fermentibacteraceae bacterium]
MRIGFDATNILGHGGIKTYARELVRGLALGFPEDSFLLLTTFSASKKDSLRAVFHGIKNVEVYGALPHVRMFGRRLYPAARLLGTVMWRRASRDLDLVHLTDPYGTAALPRRFVSTVHDLFPLTREEYAGTALEEDYRRRTPVILKRSIAVITPSSYIRDQLLDMYPESGSPVVAVPEAASDLFSPCPPDPVLLRRHRLEAEGYFLHVGRFDPRKNITRLIAAYRELPEGIRSSLRLVLVISGRPSDLDALALGQGDMIAGGELVLLRDIPLHELRMLYASATAFVFPSLDEGFGLPLLEAMSTGCPVITSNLSCIPETAGDGAMLVDPESVRDISEAMAIMARQPDRRLFYSSRGLSRSGEFSWERTAAETMEVYRAALS